MAARVAVVTGAARGIGRAIAARLASDGLRVVLADVDGPRLERAAAILREEGGEVTLVTADLGRRAEVEAVIAAALAAYGRVDVLVNNAASPGPQLPLLELPFEEWERVLRVNLSAAFLLSQLAARDMARRRSGSIVNIGAIQTRSPLPMRAAYVSSKGGLEALTMSLAVELGPLGIRVNVAQPGSVDTEGSRAELGREAREPATLLGRMGTPAEVAAVVAFLAGAQSSFLTGAVVRVDGGRLLSRRPDPFLDAGHP